MPRRNTSGILGVGRGRSNGVHSLSDVSEKVSSGEWPRSGENVSLTGEWFRPSDWLGMPAVSSTETKFAGLVAVHNGGSDKNQVSMGMTVSNLPTYTAGTSVNTTTDATTFTSASVSFVAGRLYVATITNTHGSNAALPTVTSSSGSVVFTQRATQQIDGSTKRISIFTAVPSASVSATVTSSFGGVTQTSYALQLPSFSNIDTAVSDGLLQAVIATGTGTTVSNTITVGSVPSVLVYATHANGTGSVVPSGYTSAYSVTSASPTSNTATAYLLSGVSGTITQTLTASTVWANVMLEFKYANYATIDWGDGNTESVASGTKYHYYNYSDLSSGTLSTRGYRQAIVTVVPGSGTTQIASMNLSAFLNTTTTGGDNMPTNKWLDIIVSLPNATNITNAQQSSYPASQFRLLERYWLLSSAVTTFAYFFYWMRRMQSASVVSSATVTSVSNMFLKCDRLVRAPLFNTAAVTDFSSMFSGCFSLTFVPSYNTVAGLLFNSTFQNCTKLANVPWFDLSLATNAQGMFSGCSSLTTVPFYNTQNVTNFNTMFRAATALEEVPALNLSKGTNLTNMFEACSSLSEVPIFTMPTVAFSSSNMFWNCTNLTRIPVLDFSLCTNLDSAFRSCGAAVTIGPFVATNVTVAPATFTSCTSLVSGYLSGMRYSHAYTDSFIGVTGLEEAFANLGIANGSQTISTSGSNMVPVVSLSGTTASGSTTVTMASTTGLTTGMEISATGISDAVAVTFQDSGDAVTRTAHGLVNDTRVSFATITSTTGISTYTYYYVVGATADTFQIASSVGGSALPLTTNGSGTMLYGTTISAIVPNTSITLSIPASAAGTVTTVSGTLRRSLARLRGWTVGG